MYEWRKMTPPQRAEVFRLRQQYRHPWHSPGHRVGDSGQYLITAACYNHRPILGLTPERLASFTQRLLEILHAQSAKMHAWVVLPNHYHVLVTVHDILACLKQIGLLHGRTSYEWNGADNSRGRQVWCKSAETAIKSDRHFWAALNYVHHNPVRHGYVQAWQDWPFSSASEYLTEVGRDQARVIWTEFPVLDFGKDWDPPEF